MGTSPEFRMLLMSSRKDSLLICRIHPNAVNLVVLKNVPVTLLCCYRRMLIQFVSDLCVYEEEGDLLVLQAGLQHDAFDVFPPFCQPIILRQLNLKTLIVGPDGASKKQSMYCLCFFS